MKAKKAISRVLAAAVVSAALFPLSACSPTEADRADGVYVSEYFSVYIVNRQHKRGAKRLLFFNVFELK